jgi:hypothetical protein
MRKRLLAYMGTALVLSICLLTICNFAALDRPGLGQLSTNLQPPKAPVPPPTPRYAPLQADCSAIRECLAAVLPSRYEPSNAKTVVDRGLTCLGGTEEMAWEARDCVGFEFGQDGSTGRGVVLHVSCGDECPTYAHVRVLFTENISPIHCECLGGH